MMLLNNGELINEGVGKNGSVVSGFSVGLKQTSAFPRGTRG